MNNVSLQQRINRIPLHKFRYRGPFPSDYFPTLDNDTFDIINAQPSKMQGEHWIINVNSRQILYFADSLGRKKVQFAQAAIWTDDAGTTAVPSQRLRLLHDICSF